MKRWVVALVLVPLLGGAGCEKRDRINPFDPANPDTGGVPALLDARAASGQTELVWEGADLDDVITLRIQRRHGGNAIEVLTPEGLDRLERAYVDHAVENGTLYEYRLELELTSSLRVVTAWDPATPGDAIPWVADSDGGGLSRLTPDARDALLRIRPGYWFLDLAADTLEQAVWSVDYLEGVLYQHSADGTEKLRVLAPGARAVDVDRDGESIWVGSFDERRLERRWRNGDLAWKDEGAGLIEDLLTVEPGGVWVCNREGELRIYRDDALWGSFGGLGEPVALARSENGRVLLLERSGQRVRRFEPSGIPEVTSEADLRDPLDLCGDGNGGAWVADFGRGGLVHLDASLEEVAFVASEGVLGVTWDATDSLLWVAGEGKVEIRDAAGGFVSGLSLGVRPVKVELLHGTTPE